MSRILGSILAGVLVAQGGLATVAMGDELRAVVTLTLSVAAAAVGFYLSYKRTV